MCVTNINQCPITDVQFVQNANVQNYNTNPDDYSSPQYFTQLFSSGTTLMWSNQVNSMPITTFKIATRPCMNPLDQEGNYYYALEIDGSYTCPPDTNNDLQYDPNYVKMDPFAFNTNEYEI